MHAQSGLGYILCVHASMHVHARACVYPMKCCLMNYCLLCMGAYVCACFVFHACVLEFEWCSCVHSSSVGVTVLTMDSWLSALCSLC